MAQQDASGLSAIVRRGMGNSLASLAIKLLTAGLSYVGLVVLARAMPAAEYGYFAFGLSAATVLAVAAGLGQNTAILKLWPQANAAGRPAEALRLLWASGAVTVAGALGTALVLALLVGLAAVLAPGAGPLGHLLAAAVLVVPLALAEYNSSALRSQGSIWLALTPRDLLWRASLPLVVLALLQAGLVLRGWQALVLSAALLLASLVVQYRGAAARGLALEPGFERLNTYWRAHGRAARWLLAGGLVNALALNADVLIVGLALAPESAGAYFSALRTAGLLTLFSFAISLAIAPMIAQHFHAGEREKAQALLAAGAWAGFAFSLLGYAVLAGFGEPVMRLFGESYAEAVPVLIVLGAGFVIDAAAGPSRTVLLVTGNERLYALSFGALTLVCMLAQLLVAPVYGVVGVAIAGVSVRSVTYLLLSRFSLARTGLDPTIAGVTRVFHYFRVQVRGRFGRGLQIREHSQ